MRRGKLKLAGMALGAVAGLTATHSALAYTQWLVNETVTIPPTPAVLSVTGGCYPDGSGNTVVWLTINGTPVQVTVPLLTAFCNLVPINVGGTPSTPATVQAYITEPSAPPCAVSEGGHCLASFPFDPTGSTLVVSVCVGGAPCIVQGIPL